MICVDDPRTMPAAEICRRCLAETAAYRRRERHDDRFCFEVMQRAIVRKDDACWETLHTAYSDQLLVWCRKAAGSLEIEADELVALAWHKFLRSFTAEKLALASGAPGVLAYLRACAQTVVIDLHRARAAALPFDEAIGDRQPVASPAEIHAARVAREEFWALIEAHLHDERERVFMELFYSRELRPAEIQQRRPDLFPAIALVYSTRRNVHDRLKRSPRLHAWLRGQE